MPELSEDILRATLYALEEHGSQNMAAAALGISRSAFQNRLAKAQMMDLRKEEAIELPSFVTDGDEDEPIDEIIDRMARHFERSKKAADARQWFTIKVRESKPIGILFVGDPHVDDNGCNWPVLRRHVELCRDTEGMYAINIGDSGNFWGGRLLKKYADQDTSVHTARRLVEWLLLDSGVRWLVWLMGNHE